MHRTILGAGLCTPRRVRGAAAAALTALVCLAGGSALAQAAAPARPAPCPAPGAAVVEAFIAADCADCWAADAQAGQSGRADQADAAGPRQATGPRSAARPGWRLDWITPAGDGAAMAVAALPEAAERQARAQPASGAPPAAPARGGQAPRGWALQVETGPAWHGYLGLQLALTPQPGAARWPAGSTAWLALVELLPAGSEGTAVARTLVRGLVGPLPLADGQRSTHLRALRLPETSRPERLAARAWIEAADGRILRMAADRCPPAGHPG